jgi:hypothetical protein
MLVAGIFQMPALTHQGRCARNKNKKTLGEYYVVTILLLILAAAGFSAFSFGSVERAVSATLPKLTGGQVRWAGLAIGFLAAWAGLHFIVAVIAFGAAIYLKARA